MQMNQNGSAMVALISIIILISAGALAAGYLAHQSLSQQNSTIDYQAAENTEPNDPNETSLPEIIQAGDDSTNAADTPDTATQPPAEFKQYDTASDSAPTTNAANQFALELYGEYKNTDDNLFFSPHSISSALQMTYEGARGKTAAEMRSVFHFPEDNAARIGSFAKLYEQINPQNANYQLSTANALWAQNDYPFDQNYLKTAETYYHGKTANLDFAGDTENSRKTINEWVSGKTAQKIPELFAAGTLNPLT
ncbi:MAG: serpin family protein, partial [Minisyncoccales bacterium]